MTQSELAVENWDDNLEVGYIISIVFCAIVAVTFCIAPNVCLLFKHFSSNKPLPKPDVDHAYLNYADGRTTQSQISEDLITVTDHTGLLRSNDTHDLTHKK